MTLPVVYVAAGAGWCVSNGLHAVLNYLLKGAIGLQSRRGISEIAGNIAAKKILHSSKSPWAFEQEHR